MARKKNVTPEFNAGTPDKLSSRIANLLELILVNLLENAIQATPQGGQVQLQLDRLDGRFRFQVRDHGPGFPEHLRQHLFLPCKSTREGGSGIGLAICHQLADHIGASLQLAESSPAGCRFILDLPVPAFPDSPTAADAAAPK